MSRTPPVREEPRSYHFPFATAAAASLLTLTSTPFDKAHPTSVMHDVIAQYAIEAVGTADTDGDSVVDTVDQCPWTPTDQQANTQGCSYEQLDDDETGC